MTSAKSIKQMRHMVCMWAKSDQNNNLGMTVEDMKGDHRKWDRRCIRLGRAIFFSWLWETMKNITTVQTAHNSNNIIILRWLSCVFDWLSHISDIELCSLMSDTYKGHEPKSFSYLYSSFILIGLVYRCSFSYRCIKIIWGHSNLSKQKGSV